MALVTLLGEKVNGKDKAEVEVSTLAGEGKVVGLYFSAHWCPPCRSFTPTLAEWYNKIKTGSNAANFDIVFVSSDRDEDSYDKYFGEMPWLAVSFKEREKKATLSRKFKVQGIPTLVLLNGDNAQVITTDGRKIVTEDAEGKDFPWTPKPFSEAIVGNFDNHAGETKTWEDCAGKVIGLYFSAHWCGPCRAFTPELRETYKKIQEAGKNFEIIFISSDRTDNDFKEYFNDMPWLALPFGDKRKKDLSGIFSVQGIPTLIILDENGKVITSQGRAAVTSDSTGAEFPWYPKPVNELTASTAIELNDNSCLVWFTDGEEANMASAKAILKSVAVEHIDQCKAKQQDQEVLFYYATDEEEDGVVQSLREFAHLPDTNPLLVITDINEQTVYVSEEKEITGEVVKEFVKGFQEKTLKGKPIR